MIVVATLRYVGRAAFAFKQRGQPDNEQHNEDVDQHQEQRDG